MQGKPHLYVDDLKSKVGICLVVGGSGFLGSHLVQALIQNNCSVRIISHISVDHLDPRVQVMVGDICDPDFVLEACKGVDTVFHLASVIATSRLMPKSAKEQIYSVNIRGTENVIRACQESEVNRLIYTSTNNVVFDREIVQGDETLSYAEQIIDLYTETKIEAEKKIVAANSESLLTCAIRPGGIYGPGDNCMLKRFVEALKKGTLRFTLGCAHTLGDCVYIDNLVYAHLLAARQLKKEASAVAGQVYFISDGVPANYFEFLKPLILGLGYPYPKRSIPYPLAYFLGFISELLYWLFHTSEPQLTRMSAKKVCVTNYFSIEKAKHELGYEPLVSQSEGVQQSLEYCKVLLEKTNVVKRPHIGWWISILGGMTTLGIVAFNESAHHFFSTYILSGIPMAYFQMIFYTAVLIHIVEAIYSLRLTRLHHLKDVSIGWFFQTLLLGFASLRLLLKEIKNA
jgi:3beta-hydroxy-delta5-steroid dehydrogenase/steroid delta-isomerase